MFGRRIGRGDHVGLRHRHPAQRRGLRRDRLGRAVIFARHVALGHRPLDHREERLAGDAIEFEEIAGLADMDDAGPFLAVDRQVDHRPRARHVRIPQIVMDRLVMPQIFAGLDVERDDRVAIDVRARPAAAPIIGRGRAYRHIDHAARLIDRGRERPLVGARTPLPAIAPGVVIFLPRQRHGLEFPELPASAHIEGALVARHADRIFRGGSADHRYVARDRRRAAIADTDIGITIDAEPLDRLTIGRAQRDHPRAVHHQDARGRTGIARPIADAAGRDPAAGAGLGITLDRVEPDLLAGAGIDCDDAAARGEVHRAVDHQRHDRVIGAHRVAPGELELRHVRAVDLLERRIARRGKIAVDRPPVAVGNGTLRGGDDRERRRCAQPELRRTPHHDRLPCFSPPS